jgi:hypothetical protein
MTILPVSAQIMYFFLSILTNQSCFLNNLNVFTTVKASCAFCETTSKNLQSISFFSSLKIIANPWNYKF